MLRSGLLISGGLAVGRAAGLVRDICISTIYGTGSVSDLLLIMVGLPDSVAGIVFAGAVSGVMVPRLGGMEGGKANIFVVQCIFCVVVISVMSVGLLWLLGPTHLLYPGLDQGRRDQFEMTVLIVMAIALPLTALYLAFSAWLQVKGKYLSSSVGAILVNGPIILGLLISGDILVISFFVLLGVALRLYVVYKDSAFVLPKSVDIKNCWLISPKDAGNYLLLWATAAFTAIVPVAAKSIASLSVVGTVSNYTYATRVFEVPLALVISIFGVVLLPCFSAGTVAGGEILLKRSLGFMGVLGGSLSGLMYMNAEIVCRAIFMRGASGDAGVGEISWAVKILAFGLAFAGVNSVLSAWMISRERVWVLVLSSASGLFVFLGFSVYGQGLIGLVVGSLLMHVISCLINWMCVSWVGIANFIIGIIVSVVLLVPSLVCNLLTGNQLMVAVVGGATMVVGVFAFYKYRKGYNGWFDFR